MSLRTLSVSVLVALCHCGHFFVGVLVALCHCGHSECPGGTMSLRTL